MTKKYILFFLYTFFLFACNQRREVTQDLNEPTEESKRLFRFGICIDSLDVMDYQVRPGDNLSKIYADLGFSATQSERIVSATSDLFPPRSLRSGMSYHVFTTQDTVLEISHIVFARSRTDFVVIDFLEDSIQASTFSEPITLKRYYAEGVVESSLWNAIVRDGGSPVLALHLSDIFAWQIDFFDVQKGDEYKVIYDMAYINDTVPLSIQSIEGVIFTHNKKDFIAIPFEQDSVRIFFDKEGNSLRRAFLKAPLDFFRITSRFSNSRFHPILRRHRAHHGVDYAAPTGTPVKTIGDGTVIERGYQPNGAGNYLKIRHNSVYTTTYMHLSRFASGIQRGSRVRQGEVIGFVGSTGLSTGPHLDFRVHKNGQPINPLTMEAPPDIPVKPELLDNFNVVKQNVLDEIERFSSTLFALGNEQN
jgi:murein DD-endopeptidase MepM/ murein hydrolase activator NlpD